MKRINKKLSLNRETLVTLQPDVLDAVAGGNAQSAGTVGTVGTLTRTTTFTTTMPTTSVPTTTQPPSRACTSLGGKDGQ